MGCCLSTKNTEENGPQAKKDKYDFLFKVVVLGDRGVGKTSLLLRCTDNTFSESVVNNKQAFKIRTLDLGGTIVRLQIWDTAEEEIFKSKTSSFFKGNHGVFLVYDVTNKETFTNLPSKWIPVLEQYDDKVHIVLVGNKCDKEKDRKVTTEEAQEFANQSNLEYIETSAKNDTKVQEAFSKMASSIKEKIE